MSFDVEQVRKDFPIFEREVNGHPLVYLDSANTSQKPVQVLDVMRAHQERYNGNVSRSVHTLGTESTEAYEGARARIAAFIGAASPDEVVFTKNSTEALNLVAHSAGQMLKLGPGDEIVISEMEHHSNIVPWQLLCERTGATLRWFGITDEGWLDQSSLESLITPRTKIVSVVHMSNVLGTINDISEISARARDVGALLVLDCSQSVPHLPINVRELGADLIAFTGHKMLGPTGIGVLWGRFDLLSQMPPFLGGGSMIETVTMTGTTYAAPPARFEAGTPPITEAIGLGAAVDYLSELGMDAVHRHEQAITAYALDALSGVTGVRIFGPATPEGRGGTVSFGVDGVHPHDVGQILDALGVEVRVGHHCARPVCSRFSVPAMTRASFYLYTTTDEIDALARGLDQVRKVFG
ncbi:putative aminotransferase [Actinoplanes missouriensis 431]|uniref:cysteine desulfurase n=1 Tax=Actinoplanes missouriensis (strain ATCC 14538 / DSM 43046 / CBS 188.64 / JCM 3121 / NBRC 102363 / NCIMB 12654 / NRRL B-3342 / UNCC 431) TaxID=512565 RepID=I0H1G3_ACTM4|nr:cysteine desulfurase [Actinoplanes missouriensis]BAL86850.1 putative aminotransferase [Actinoplanes missouriensis 431]